MTQSNLVEDAEDHGGGRGANLGRPAVAASLKSGPKFLTGLLTNSFSLRS